MSTFLYGAVSAQRQAAPPNTSKVEKQPGLGSYVDVVAALVPAEVLAANAALLPVMSSTEEKGGQAVTTITQSGTLEVVFWLSIAFSILIFVVGQLSRRKTERAKDDVPVQAAPWGFANCLRAAVPPLAYVAWTMLQKSTAFDALAPSMSQSLRLTLAVFGAIALGVVAKGLSDQADGQDPSAH